MSDEELDKLIAGEPEEETPTEEPEQPQPEGEPEEPTEEEPETEAPETPPSRREQLRINQLLAKMKQQPQEQPKAKGLNYAEELDAEPEVIQKLESDRQAASDASYQRAMEQVKTSEWRTMLNVDAPQVETRYDILNPRNEEKFHPALAEGLTNWYLNMTGYDAEKKTVNNPDIRWGDFVDGVMELAEEIATSKVETATKTIKQQAANTAIRPDGSTTKSLNLNQAPESMSDEELDAVIAQAIPKK